MSKKAIVLYLHVHQPYRIKHYTVFDAASDHDYFFGADYEENANNERILKKVAEKSYIPTNNRLLKILEENPGFKLSLSITGTVIEQMERWSPESLESFKQLAASGRVEIVAETYHHTLAYFYSRKEFEIQVDMHKRKIEEVFGQYPTVFRNTELSYNNELAKWADEAGYKGILAEGWDPILQWRSPNYVYEPVGTNNIKLLLKNYKLSDDIAFRFGDHDWSEWPLTADKFMHWISEDQNATNINLFMDYETFGEHQWGDSGIFDFLEHMPKEWLKTEDHSFMTVSEVIDNFEPVDKVDVPYTVTWADTERDLSAWLGNALQTSSISSLYELEDKVLGTNDLALIDDWRRLQTSDHFYYMCTKWFSDGDIHAYFSPYKTPYEAYMNFMNSYHDIRYRIAQSGVENYSYEIGGYMGRPVVLSNGQLFIGLDESGLVHDFYYPYVGLENLTNARSTQHKVGLWVDGKFSWTDDGSWDIHVDFEDEALISHIELENKDLQINLIFQDFVDMETNSFIRHITLANPLDRERDVRLFMHQVFQISRAGRADTALYVPDNNYILDYKGRYSLAISGKFHDGESFDQYAVGNYGIEDKAGTYKDAEDGELSGNAVEHGGVDSVIRFKRTLDPKKSESVDYWIVASSSQSDAEVIIDVLKSADIEKRLESIRNYWHKWINGQVEIPNYHKRSLTHSLLVIKAHIDERGSILASGDSSIFNFGRDYYCYCWPRDAAYALWPLIRLGHFEEAKQFFEFARDTRHKDGYLMHKYQPDRAIGSTWHPLVHGRRKELAIQEDETASVIYMIGQYYEASKDKTFIEHIYRSFVIDAANFMVRFIDESTGLPHASYDLWEEKFLTSTYTVSAVIAGLDTASYLAKVVESPDDAVRWSRAAQQMRDNLDKLFGEVGYFVKGYLLQESGELKYDYTLDISSLYGPFMFSGIEPDDHRLMATVDQVEKRLLNSSPAGGVLRYENDNYFLTKRQYKGNPWIVSTLWLAQYYVAINKQQKAEDLLKWSIARELPSSVLSEQFDPEDGSPLGVTPLVWSHAELVNSLLDLSKHQK